MEKLGQGSFGTVVRAIWLFLKIIIIFRKLEPVPIALKLFEKNKMNSLKNSQYEVQILTNLRGRSNIIEAYDFRKLNNLELEDQRFSGDFYGILMEYGLCSLAEMLEIL